MSKKFDDQESVRKELLSDAEKPNAKKFGRRTSYYPERCEEIILRGLEGDFPVQMASNMGVSFDTLYEWNKKYPEFAEAFKLAKQHAAAWWLDLGRDNIKNPHFNTALYSQITRTQRGSHGYNGKTFVEFKEAKGFREKLAIVDEYLSIGAITINEADKLYGMVEKYVKIVDAEEIQKNVYHLMMDKRARDEESKQLANKKN